MELPKIKKPDSGMFGNIKDKLGFAGGRGDHEGYDEFDDAFNEDQDGYSGADEDYNDFGEYAYDGDYGDLSSYSPTYGDPMHAPLVSLDEVRASTQVPESLTRDPLAPTSTASSAPSTPYGSVGSQGGYGSAYSSASQDDGYVRPASAHVPRDEAFGADVAGTTALHGAEDPPGIGAYGADKASDFDPYEANTGSGYTPTRGLHVIKPVAYREVERIAKALKGGDAVVLCFRNTPDQLMKRMLDFSFGVSSALDARVECIADKVFVITRGSALSEQEKMQLRDQGVL